MNSFYKTCLAMVYIVVFTCYKYKSDRSPSNYTDTIQLISKRILGDPNMVYKPPGPSIQKILLIRQKTDSTLKFTYYWNYPDSMSRFSYVFNIKNDSLHLISHPYLTFVRTFEDKEDPAIRLYKYESMDTVMRLNRSVVFSREHGQIGSAFFIHNAAWVVTHWKGKPIDKRYHTLLMRNLKQVLTEEWYTNWYEKKKIKKIER